VAASSAALEAEATAHLRKALKLDPRSARLSWFCHELLRVSRSQIAGGLGKQAAHTAGLALMIIPDSAEGHLLRGRALIGVDDRAAAEHLGRAAELAPKVDGIDVFLAQASFAYGKRLSERGRRRGAEKMLGVAALNFEKAAARAAGNPVHHFNYGQALLYLSRVQGDPAPTRKRAMSAFEQAIKLGRYDPNVYANSCWWLATLKESEKDFAAATKYFDKAALAYGADSPLAKRAKTRADRVRGRR
jgi:tetratricopeptide (TPR) repeat protein